MARELVQALLDDLGADGRGHHFGLLCVDTEDDLCKRMEKVTPPQLVQVDEDDKKRYAPEERAVVVGETHTRTHD